MPENGQIALVSGGNRGIGLEIVRRLVEGDITVILGSRHEKEGQEAVEELFGDVVVRQLDVADAERMNSLGSSIEEEFGPLDVLLNNAKILNDEDQRGVDTPTSTACGRRLRPTCLGRGGCMRRLYRSCRATATEESSMSQVIAEPWRTWTGSPAYRVSKGALNALTRILASALEESDILLNSVSPGWVYPDVGGSIGGSETSRFIEEGAGTPVWAATLPSNGPTGGFFRDRQQMP